MLAPLFIMLLVMLPILIPAIKRQLKKPDVTDADMFKDFVSNDLFPDLDIVVPLNFPEQNLCTPDISFLDTNTNFEFYIKCFYCADVKKNHFKWCTDQAFRSYQNLTGLPLFIIVGLGGPSHFPDELYMLPFSKISSNKLSMSQLNQHKIKYGDKIDFSML